MKPDLNPTEARLTGANKKLQRTVNALKGRASAQQTELDRLVKLNTTQAETLEKCHHAIRNLHRDKQEMVSMQDVREVVALFRHNAGIRTATLTGVKDEQRRRELRSEIIGFEDAADVLEHRLLSRVVAYCPDGAGSPAQQNDQATEDHGRIVKGKQVSPEMADEQANRDRINRSKGGAVKVIPVK